MCSLRKKSRSYRGLASICITNRTAITKKKTLAVIFVSVCKTFQGFFTFAKALFPATLRGKWRFKLADDTLWVINVIDKINNELFKILHTAHTMVFVPFLGVAKCPVCKNILLPFIVSVIWNCTNQRTLTQAGRTEMSSTIFMKMSRRLSCCVSKEIFRETATVIAKQRLCNSGLRSILRVFLSRVLILILWFYLCFEHFICGSIGMPQVFHQHMSTS